jgi:hypothetical protein
MSDFTVSQNENSVIVVEWFDKDGYVFDAAGITAADVTALQLCCSTYDLASVAGKARMKGMLRLVVELWNRDVTFDSAEVLTWINDQQRNNDTSL